MSNRLTGYLRESKTLQRILGHPLTVALSLSALYLIVVIPEASRYNTTPVAVVRYCSAHLRNSSVSSSDIEMALKNPKSIDNVVGFWEREVKKTAAETGGYLFLNEDVMNLYKLGNPLEKMYERHEEFVRRIEQCSEERFPLLVQEYSDFMDNCGYGNHADIILKRINEGMGKSRLGQEVKDAINENRTVLCAYYAPTPDLMYDFFEKKHNGILVARFHFHKEWDPPSDTDIETSKNVRIVVFSPMEGCNDVAAGFNMYDLQNERVKKFQWRKDVR